MKKAVKQEEPGSHWESHIFKFTCFYNVNQFVTHQLLDWAKLAQKEAGWGSQQFLAYIRMVNKWLWACTYGLQANGHVLMVSYTLT